MRISAADKVTPRGGPRRNSRVTQEQYEPSRCARIWQELAPRLIHPAKIHLIEALSWIGEPLSVTQLFAVLAPSESSIDYVRYHLKGLGSAHVLIEVPDRDIRHPDEPRYWFATLAGTEEPTKQGEGVAGI